MFPGVALPGIQGRAGAFFSSAVIELIWNDSGNSVNLWTSGRGAISSKPLTGPSPAQP